MKHYQNPDLSIHAFELDGSQDFLITPDMQPISDAELLILRTPPPPTPAQQLAALDAANTLTQRNLREFILLATEALKLGQAIDLSVLPGVAKVAEVEAAAALLRAQL